MNRIELIIATAIVLFIAFLMGWFTHWVIHRFVRVGDGDMSDLDTMAQQLHDAEEQRESEMNNQQTQTEAELRAAMEGLREARHEAEELRAYIERQSAD
jgi:prophage endopeptidase